MDRERLAAREHAVSERARARLLRVRARQLRQQADRTSQQLVESLRLYEGAPFGEDGDAFALRLPRMPVAVGLLRQDFRHWLERRGVGPDDAADIIVACAEACANAVEHPLPGKRPVFEVDARISPAEVKVVVRDFGSWSDEAPADSSERGRGLDIIESLRDEVAIVVGEQGTRVTMRRRLGHSAG